MDPQAAKQPHQDVSSQEAERAVRLSEHLLYLQRQQRAALRTAAEFYDVFGQLEFLLAGFSGTAVSSDTSNQVATCGAPLALSTYLLTLTSQSSVKKDINSSAFYLGSQVNKEAFLAGHVKCAA